MIARVQLHDSSHFEGVHKVKVLLVIAEIGPTGKIEIDSFRTWRDI